MKKYLLFIPLIISVLSCKNNTTVTTQKTKYEMFVGSYTKKEAHVDGKGEGIYRIELDENLNEIKRSVISDVVNPSYLCLNKKGTQLFCVEETNPEGFVSSYNIDNQGFKKINRVSSQGGAPCYISYTNQKNGFCFTANYVGGNACMYALGEDGSLSEKPSMIKFEGKGKIAGRQDAPHPHSALLMGEDASKLLVGDLGTDQLNVINVNYPEVKLSDNQPIKLNAGDGTRHIVMNKSNIYVACELSNRVAFIDDTKRVIDEISTLPDNFQGTSLVSDIKITPNGKFLYVANRGDNSLAAFQVREDGFLKKIDIFSCKGLIPRNFSITPDGKYLFCSNQNSDNIALFSIEEDGKLTFKKDLLVKTPTCIVFR
jgi:6-phosphogluconolactonase